MRLSRRVLELKPSPTLALVAKAKALKAQGFDVISLAVGEPDWPTFQSASDAGKRAIDGGRTKYTPAEGSVEVRKAIALSLLEETGIEYSLSEITVTAGAKFMISVALQSLVNPGDEVLMQAPYWVSYPTMVELADGKPVLIPTDATSNYKLTGQLLEKYVSPRSKVLILNSPSNPTGLFSTEEELQGLAETLRRHPQLTVISDDIYNRLVISEKYIDRGLAPHLLQIAPDLRDRVININGVSKSYSMTGWRIGWAAGPEVLIKAMANYQSQALGCASSISQEATEAAILNSKDELVKVRRLLQSRALAAVELLRAIDGVKVVAPEGAFYLWVDISAFLGKTLSGVKISTCKDFCQALLEKEQVVVVPGAEFGDHSGFLRMSYAIEEKRMSEAVLRLKRFVLST